MPPQKIGQLLLDHMPRSPLVERVEMAGPGFLNFYLSPAYYTSVVEAAVRGGADFGRTNRLAGEKIMVEFVSANPTGPMHMGLSLIHISISHYALF